MGVTVLTLRGDASAVALLYTLGREHTPRYSATALNDTGRFPFCTTERPCLYQAPVRFNASAVVRVVAKAPDRFVSAPVEIELDIMDHLEPVRSGIVSSWAPSLTR